MNETLRKILLFGVGSAYYSKEKVEEFVHDLSKKENINKDEGKKLVSDFLDRSKKFKQEQQKDIKEMVNNAMNEAGYVSKKEFDKLQKELNQMKKRKKASVKKPKKTTK